MRLRTKSVLMFAAVAASLVGATSVASAAYTLSTPNTAVLETFTGFTGTSDPANWVTAGQSAWRGQGIGTGNTNGAYSYGADADGSIGFLASASATTAPTATATYTNSTGTTLTGLNVSYNAELWRIGGRASTFTVSYSINGGGFTAIDSLGYIVADPSGGTNGVAGTGAATAKTASLTGLSIAPGSTISFQWAYSGGNGSGARSGIALDDVSVTGVGAAAAAKTAALSATTPSGTFRGTANVVGSNNLYTPAVVATGGATEGYITVTGDLGTSTPVVVFLDLASGVNAATLAGELAGAGVTVATGGFTVHNQAYDLRLTYSNNPSSGGNFFFAYNGFGVDQVAIAPEPAALGLLAPVGLLAARRRRA